MISSPYPSRLMHAESGTRRLTPRPWHTDWLMLRKLGAVIGRELASVRRGACRVA